MKDIRIIVRLILLVLLAIMSGCSLLQSRVDISSVVIDVALDANDNAPVAVDMVAISDVALLPQIQSLSAEQWFNAKPQFLRDAPNALHIWSLELVPDSRFVSETNPPTPFCCLPAIAATAITGCASSKCLRCICC